MKPESSGEGRKKTGEIAEQRQEKAVNGWRKTEDAEKKNERVDGNRHFTFTIHTFG